MRKKRTEYIRKRTESFSAAGLLSTSIILIWLALLPGLCLGATYYLDANLGNDSYPGTSALPWKTVSYALGTTSPVGPGDTVYLRGGTYREQVKVEKYGTSGNWITVKSYPGEMAVLDGTYPVTGWTQAQLNDPYLTVQGVVNPNYNNIYWTRVQSSEFPSDLSNTVFFENRVMCRSASDPDQSVGWGEETLEMRNVGEASNGQASYLIDPTLNQQDDYWNGAIIRVFLYNYNANVVQKNVADYIKNDHKIIFDSDMPANLRYDADRKDRYRFLNHPHILDSAGEFYITGIETVSGTDYRRIYYWPENASNLTNKMTMASRDMAIYRVEGVANYLIIEDLTVFGTKGTGIYFQGAGNGEQRGSHVIVRNCTITDCGGWGIYYVYMNYARAENNYVRRCNQRGIMGNAVDHCVFKNNNVGDTGTTNISFYNATNSMIINNILHGIRGGHGNGVSVYAMDGLSEDILIAGNQFYNTNMAFNNVRNLTVFANLFRGDESDPSPAITAWSSRYDGHQVWIHNTVPIAATYALALQQRNVGETDLPRHYIVNNVLHGLLKGWDEKWDEYDPTKVKVEDRTYNVYTYYSWMQDGFGWSLKEGEQDCRSTPLTDMFVNPTYPDGDYHLKADSPLSSAGKNVQGILTNLGIIAKFPEYDFTKDLAGNPWNSNPSIGAYEYISATPPPPPIIYGDINGNGEVTSYDAALAARYAVGLETFTDEQRQKADVSGNGAVSAYDAAWIARRAVDDTVVFPVEQ